MSAKLLAISLKITAENTKILFEQSKYKNKRPWYLNSITLTNWMRVFLSISCLLVYTWCPVQLSQGAHLILQLIIVNSYSTLGIQTHQSLKVFFAEIIGSPQLHVGIKTTLKYWFYCLSLGKHNNAWTVKLFRSFRWLLWKQFSSESSILN